MPKVELKGNMNPELAIRRFKRLCDRAGIVADVRKKDFYEKPTWERKRRNQTTASKIRSGNRIDSESANFDALMRGLARAKVMELVGTGKPE